ncbi:anhydro-N-acetylmuramic acid kinase [Carboxylicivirga sp. A043]|uniref:anhydro-N-acetylmuramic acid kinase n=1 Tax=Carboxylicivirga litoralis TaxID=2816963 RepID=UPI0021CB1909|nr:anhydro-N-acetylmuramic acid kinase [Carboxylicivirga sp. A043]MCU4157585.1 anhydro-N-acetylmuramic acid kinase [Carboxylicivirga sp. A043]
MIKQIKNSYCCVGLMSGTSLDGLDMVLCQLEKRDNKWVFDIKRSETIDYSAEWRERLKGSPNLSGKELMLLHRNYGKWLGSAVHDFLKDESTPPDLIASHGHTVFHEPQNQFNFQLGDGNMIAAITGVSTVSDFRSLDVCLNGQGAPLVPIGDQLLFSEYEACVNIGGFVNVSCDIDGVRRAWDICPANFVINRLVGKMGLSMDENGAIGLQGKIIQVLLQELNELPYYQQTAPKSLAQEWVDNSFWPIVNKYDSHDLPDVIRTCYEHFARVISNDLNRYTSKGTLLFTGGGVFNLFLMDLIKQHCKTQVIIPEKQLVNYKEALIFALLGVLRYRGEVNCLKTVTGATHDACSGVVILR